MRAVRLGTAAIVLAAGVLGAAATAGTTPAAYPRPGLTLPVSIRYTGSETSASYPSVSADGRYVAFISLDANLVPGDTNNSGDVFVRDRRTGTTERVSVGNDGQQTPPYLGVLSGAPAISADGRYVAFAIPGGAHLARGDSETLPLVQVFLRDRVRNKTELISVASNGTEGDNSSYSPSISADGRYVAFTSYAGNLASGDANNKEDVYLHDRVTGRTVRVSDPATGDSDGDSHEPAISANGRFVAFSSTATNLVAGDSNRASDVFERNMKSGQIERVSVASDGGQTLPNMNSGTPAISGDGRLVAFTSTASNLVPGKFSRAFDVFVHDRTTGVTERVSVSSTGAEGNGLSDYPTLSRDGRFVAFESSAKNLVPADNNGLTDAFVHDRVTGSTERVSVTSSGAEVNDLSVQPNLSADGRFVAFEGAWQGSGPAYSANGTSDGIFVHDRGWAGAADALDLSGSPGGLHASGWATFSGATLTSQRDAKGDATVAGADASALGTDITRASVIYRPEHADLLLRLSLLSLPAPATGGAPGVLYRWTVRAGGTTYEVRVARAEADAQAASGPPPSTQAVAQCAVLGPCWLLQAQPSYVALFDCTSACTAKGRLSGSVGTTGNEVWATVPLSVLGAKPGITLTGLTASTALGSTTAGPLSPIDSVRLSQVVIPTTKVSIGVAPASTPAGRVDYRTRAALTSGRFTANLRVSSLRRGSYLVWARACLGSNCGYLSEPYRR